MSWGTPEKKTIRETPPWWVRINGRLYLSEPHVFGAAVALLALATAALLVYRAVR